MLKRLSIEFNLTYIASEALWVFEEWKLLYDLLCQFSFNIRRRPRKRMTKRYTLLKSIQTVLTCIKEEYVESHA